MLVAFSAVASLFLLPYAVKGYDYPVSWGAATYVAKARSAAEDGVALLGLVRPGGSVLLAVLMRATGQNALTLVAIMPAVLAAMVGLGAAAMVRSGLGIRPMWVPVIAVVTWVAFVKNEIMTFHFDNLVNAAFIVAGFGAAMAFAAGRKGAIGAALLFVAAGLSHWPFYMFAMGIFVAAIVLFVWVPVGAVWNGWRDRLRRTFPLLGAAAASGALVGPSLLWTPPTGWTGVKLGSIEEKLHRKFLNALRQPHSLYALPVSAAGVVAATRSPRDAERADGRRLFVSLMSGWTLVSIGAVLAQWAGMPTAGARVITFFFPLSILGGVTLWWIARWVARRIPGRSGVVAGCVVVVVAVGALSALTERWWAREEPLIQAEAIAQVMSAGRYLDEVAPGQQAVFLVKGGLQWWITQASLPPDQLTRAFPYYGPVDSFLAGLPKRGYKLRFGPPSDSLRPQPVGILIERLNPAKFRRRSSELPDRVVAPGVLILRGPLPARPLAAEVPPTANVGVLALLWIPVFILGLLTLAGGGWAMALLPSDPLLRLTLAPALGAAVMVLSALLWGIGDLPFTGPFPLIPVAVAAAVGWVLAWSTRRDKEPVGRIPPPRRSVG
jgi:hypothetical protein